MRKMHNAIITAFVALAVLGMWGITASADSTTASAAAQSPVIGPAARAGSGQPRSIGIPAIRPRASSADPATPAFTEQDVRQYVAQHPMPHNLSDQAPYSITQVKLVTSQAAGPLLGGASTGLPDAALVYYVELQGTFTFVGPHGTTVTFHTGQEIFDAHTGNLVVLGGQP